MADTKLSTSEPQSSSVVSGRARAGTIGERRNPAKSEARRQGSDYPAGSGEPDETSRRRERANQMRIKNKARQMR